ncbi:MAG TPA: hypothetical protein VGR25_03760 [bacterium]|nr:hypothetical protein [bacterium]
MTQRQIDETRNALQAIVSALGRDDIGVGEVSEQGGVVSFTLTKGRFTHSDQIPADLLADKERALPALNGIVRKLSKQIESDHIEHAARPAE